MPIMRPWTRHLLGLIEAGIHDRATLIERTTPFVPQGHAFRSREIARARQVARDRTKRGDDLSKPLKRDLERSAAHIHRVGAAQVIRLTLSNLEKAGRIVRDETGHYYLLTQTERPSPAVSEKKDRTA